jgi:TolB protein
MKKPLSRIMLLIIVGVIACGSCTAHDNTIEIAASGGTQTHMPITLMIFDGNNSELNEIAHTITKDLHFTEQFQVAIKKYDAALSKKQLAHEIKSLSTANIPLTLCLRAKSKSSLEWSLYDTMQGTIIKNKKYKKKGSATRGWAHAIADNVWETLTGNDGFFSSRIAYCKESKTKKGTSIRNVYLVDFDGSNEELLVDVPTIIIAPRWHPKEAKLFYSEYTPTNVRLMETSMAQKKQITSNLDGINMLPEFSQDGKTVLYCASHGDGSCQLYQCTKNSSRKFTQNTGNNVSPIFLDNERICFCSDFQTKSPQIYIGNIQTGHVQRITKGGYCTSPAYCPKTDKLAYHMMVKGIMQLCIYDLNTKIHTQITFGKGNKHESSWSPCGTHLVFSEEYAGNSRIAALSFLTNKTKYLTDNKSQCNYPSWSPCYDTFPVVT